MVPIAVGAGVINDLVKYAAYRRTAIHVGCHRRFNGRLCQRWRAIVEERVQTYHRMCTATGYCR